MSTNFFSLAFRQHMSSISSSLLLLTMLMLLTGVVNICTFTLAIHEDEQGVRDWVRRFVGNVELTSVQPVAKPTQLYVSSIEGTVAALSLSPLANGADNILWRQLFNDDTPQCLHAGKTAIMVVTTSGTVYVLNPQTGAIEITFLLDFPADEIKSNGVQLKHVTCVEINGKATIVAQLNEKAHVFTFIMDESENEFEREDDAQDDNDVPEEFITPKQSFLIGLDVTHLSLTVQKGGYDLWVNRASVSNTSRYNISTGQLLQKASGLFVGLIHNDDTDDNNDNVYKVVTATSALPPEFHVITRKGNNNSKVTRNSVNKEAKKNSPHLTSHKSAGVLVRQGNEYALLHVNDNAATTSTTANTKNNMETLSHEADMRITCENCSAIVSTSHLTQSHVGVTYLSWNENTLRLHFPSGALITLPAIANAHDPELLIAFTRDTEELALVKTGSLDLLLVSASRGLLWHRPEGVTQSVATLLINSANHTDHLHLNQEVIFVSSRGVLYYSPLTEMGARLESIVDFSAALLHELNISSIDKVILTKLYDNGAGHITVEAHDYSRATVAHVQIDCHKRIVISVNVIHDVLFSENNFTVMQNLSVLGHWPETEKGEPHHGSGVSFYTVNLTTGEVHGYLSETTEHLIHPSWTVKVPSTIVAHTSGNIHSRTAIVNALHVYPNVTDGEPSDVVLQRYPMRNVIALAYYDEVEEELPTLIVLAIDAVTGSILASTSHKNVEGEVHMLIAEHALVYYFLDAQKMRYCFGVWELFEEVRHPVKKTDIATFQQMITSFFTSRQRAFSSRASLPPMVQSSVLGVYGGPLADMSLTTSQDAIARKSVVLAYKSGRVAIVELRQLFAGGQMPIPRHTDRQLTHVIIPSIFLATHRYRLALPRYITTQPTQLESSSHVLVNGIDIFYIRSSSGKPFDILNPDFNKPLLITLCVSFAVVSLIARYVVMRKGLYVLWK